MKKILFVSGCLLMGATCFAQSIPAELAKAFQKFEADSQLKHAVSSLYVIEVNTGEVVFDKNSQVGLAPASTQKIITSVTAFELLGKNYRYKTEFGYFGEIIDDKMMGSLYVIGSGDPTLGSWRWPDTEKKKLFNSIGTEFTKLNLPYITGHLTFITNHFETLSIPDGWIWQDIGNYYGAGASVFNWHENQYDLFLQSGNYLGDSVRVVSTEPQFSTYWFLSETKSAAKGTGDNAYIYLPIGLNPLLVKGTIPVNEDRFKISGSFPDPIGAFGHNLFLSLRSQGLEFATGTRADYIVEQSIKSIMELRKDQTTTPIYIHYSPSLDSIIYWFNKKSINLYGEALVKTFAYEKQGFGSTDSGVAIVKKFWKNKGLDEDELNIYDGSGLSPLNRVTTHAQVEILKYARTRDWFNDFYNSLPIYNDMHMKSGTISDVKGFCGYHKAKDGKEYIFSFLVNNYSGRSSGLVGKMYKVLDVLK